MREQERKTKREVTIQQPPWSIPDSTGNCTTQTAKCPHGQTPGPRDETLLPSAKDEKDSPSALMIAELKHP